MWAWQQSWRPGPIFCCILRACVLLLNAPGFTLSYDICQSISPARTLTLLGFYTDTRDMEVYIMQQRQSESSSPYADGYHACSLLTSPIKFVWRARCGQHLRASSTC